MRLQDNLEAFHAGQRKREVLVAANDLGVRQIDPWQIDPIRQLFDLLLHDRHLEMQRRVLQGLSFLSDLYISTVNEQINLGRWHSVREQEFRLRISHHGQTRARDPQAHARQRFAHVIEHHARELCRLVPAIEHLDGE